MVVPQASTVAWELGDTPKDTQILWVVPQASIIVGKLEFTPDKQLYYGCTPSKHYSW